jgi:hypothetical protein
MLKKIIATIGLDILNTAIAIVAVSIAIRIFYLMFLFSRPTGGYAILRQIPNLSNFLMAVTITYFIFRLILFVASKLRLDNFDDCLLLFCGNISFIIGYWLFSLLRDISSATILLPVIVFLIGVPSLCISSILHVCGLYHLLLQWIQGSRKDRDR